MWSVVRYAWRLVWRNPGRTGTYLFGLATAVGLFASILFFVDVSSKQMTANTLAPVQLDMIAHATVASLDGAAVQKTLAAQDGLKVSEPVTASDFAGTRRVGAAQEGPAGRMLALREGYFQQFNFLSITEGRFDPRGAMVSEALAMSQGIRIGDRVAVRFAGLPQPVELPVTGVVNTSNADPMFATTDPNKEAEYNVVSDLVFVDLDWFRQNLQSQLSRLPVTADTGLGGTGAVALPVDQQFHLRIDRDRLPADPTRAQKKVQAIQRGLERQFPGELKISNNLDARFAVAAADVSSAKILFLFLGLPGVALAAYLSKYAAEIFAETQRREFGLLRTRGAGLKHIAALVVASSVLLALMGTVVGLGLGAGMVAVALGGRMLVQGDWRMFAHSAGQALLAGLGLTFSAAFFPALASLQRGITDERRKVSRAARTPLWQRMYLDVVLLVAAAVILAVTLHYGGFKPKGTEGQVLELSFYLFLSPFCTWTGLTLLLLRLSDRALLRGKGVLSGVLARLFGEIGEAAGRGIARRSGRVAAAVTILALTISFGVSLAIFDQTYSAARTHDARYVVGSDIRITPALTTPQTTAFAQKLANRATAAVTAVYRDNHALIGAERQTVYGIDVEGFRRVAQIPDAFFDSGSASANLAALEKTPNGVLISKEQADKYNIEVGDTVLMRLYNRATKQYHLARAKAVGLFTYFPTSAQDSDFVLNRSFMATESGYPDADFFLVKTNGGEEIARTLAQQYRETVGRRLPVQVQDLATVVKADESSLTSLNLGGLGRIEQFYTILIVTLGLAVFLLAMINDRRREFGAMRALGADLRQLGRFILAEAATIGGISLVFGGAVGVVLARLMIFILRVIFVVPPQGAVWPVGQLAWLLGLAVAGMLGSAWISARRLSRLKVVEALREI